MKIMRSIIKPSLMQALLALQILCLAGCSLKLLYNNLDTMLVEYVDGVVSMDEHLEYLVDERATQLLHWHREHQLAPYVLQLRAWQQSFASGVTQSEVFTHIENLQLASDVLVAKLEQEMALLLPQLDVDQINEFVISVEQKNQNFHDKYIDITEQKRLEEYNDRMQDLSKDWLGSLSQQQQKMIVSASSQIKSGASLRLKSRKQWLYGIRNILKSEKSVTDKEIALKDFFAQHQPPDKKELEKILRDNNRVTAALLVKIIRSSSNSQRQYFIDKTNEYIELFEELQADR